MVYWVGTITFCLKNCFISFLSGWYRNCGVIPFTSDIDIAVWIENYDVQLKKSFIGNTIVWLWMSLGKVEQGLEMRLYSEGFDYDIFFVYKENKTHQWSSYQGERKFYKYRV